MGFHYAIAWASLTGVLVQDALRHFRLAAQALQRRAKKLDIHAENSSNCARLFLGRAYGRTWCIVFCVGKGFLFPSVELAETTDITC